MPRTRSLTVTPKPGIDVFSLLWLAVRNPSFNSAIYPATSWSNPFTRSPWMKFLPICTSV